MTRLILPSVLALVAFSPAPASAQAVVPPGDDGWQTQAGTAVGIPVNIPRGFFGQLNRQPSDPIQKGTKIALRGGQIGPCPPGPCEFIWLKCHKNPNPADTHEHCVKRVIQGNCDTIVKRRLAATFTAVNQTRTIPVEIVALSLRGTLPVTFGTAGTLNYTVEVSPTPTQPSGTMSLTSTALAPELKGTMKLASLPVVSILTFKHTGRTTVMLPPFTVPLGGSDGTFRCPSAVPAAERWALILLAVTILAVGAFLITRRSRPAPTPAV